MVVLFVGIPRNCVIIANDAQVCNSKTTQIYENGVTYTWAGTSTILLYLAVLC